MKWPWRHCGEHDVAKITWQTTMTLKTLQTWPSYTTDGVTLKRLRLIRGHEGSNDRTVNAKELTSKAAGRNEGHATDPMTLPAVNDLDSSWRDGVLLCRLLDVLCSGCTMKVQQLNPVHRLRNCRLALQLASKHLQLPPVANYLLWCQFGLAVTRWSRST